MQLDNPSGNSSPPALFGKKAIDELYWKMDRIRRAVVLLSILCAGGSTVVSGSRKYQEFNLTWREIADKFGYPSETHNIETEDGFYLLLTRVPHGKTTAATRETPVLLMHGMVASADEFLLLEENSLAFVLANAGFDVWLPNFRGNSYSRTHKRLTVDDKEFWDFSWHENGVYDLPASIDYICNYTKSEDVLFVGYSMGVTAFFVMASERPEYQRKVRGGVMLGPVAFLKHVNFAVKLIAPFSSIIQVGVVLQMMDNQVQEQRFYSETSYLLKQISGRLLHIGKGLKCRLQTFNL